MRKKIGKTGILLFLGLTITFQIAYYIWLRGMISNESMYLHTDLIGGIYRITPRDSVDHLVCCVGLVHYFLCGYLYSVKKHYAEKNLNGKNGKTKRWVGLEIFCQLGIFFSYFFVWIDNYKLCDIDETIRPWRCAHTHIEAVLYMFLCEKKIISMKCAWVEQYGNIFELTFIIAPVLLMLLIYSIHCVFRLIQFKRSGCFNMIWAVWTVIFFLAIIVLDVWQFWQMDLERWWHWYFEELPYSIC